MTVSQIMWCKDLTECLMKGSPDEVLEAVKGAEQRCFDVMETHAHTFSLPLFLSPSPPLSFYILVLHVHVPLSLS